MLPSGRPPVDVDRFAFFKRSPAAYRVKILKRKAHRVHHVVTARADRVGTVFGQSFTHGKGCRDRVVLECRHVWQRRRWRRPDDIFQNPLAANYWRRSVGVRRHSENASLAKQPSTFAVLIQRNSPEPAAVDIGDSIMLGEAFIQISVVRLQQIENIPIFAQDAFEEELRFLPEGLPQVIVEIWKQS